MDGSSPADAAQLRRRGLLWLVIGFAVCPCHLPVTLLAVGTVLGGSALGATITGNPLAVGVALGTLTVLAYLKGLRLLSAADRCNGGACDTGGRSGASPEGAASSHARTSSSDVAPSGRVSPQSTSS